MAKFELSNEVKPLDRIISRLAGECGYEVQQVFNDLLRYIIHGFSPGAPPLKDWKYKRQQNMAFLEMTREWVGIMQRQTALSGWFDAFGELHMAYASVTRPAEAEGCCWPTMYIFRAITWSVKTSAGPAA